jgi:hypothetical protein
MGLPLVPIIVGVSAFLLGLGAGTVARGEDGEFDLDDVVGERIEVALKSGGAEEGDFQSLNEDYLSLAKDNGQFLHIPLEDVKSVYVYA